MAVRCVHCPLKTALLLPLWLMDSTLLLWLFYGSLSVEEHQIFVIVYCQLSCRLYTVEPARQSRGGHRKRCGVHLHVVPNGWWLSRDIAVRKRKVFEMPGQTLGPGGNIRILSLYQRVVLELCFGSSRSEFIPGYRLQRSRLLMVLVSLSMR
jgi:hypothetical protein